MATTSTRGAAWSDTEVKTLIALWADRNVQEQIQGSVRNNHIYKKMSKDMKEKRFSRDAEQCKAKIKNLKTEYRQVKDNNNKTGRGRKTFKYYDELDAVLGHRPASRPPVVLDATVGGLSVEPSQEGERDSTDNDCGKTMTYSVPSVPSAQ